MSARQRRRIGTPLTLCAVVCALAASPSALADPPTGAIRYTHDPDGRITSVVDPGQGSARYGWDRVGNLLSVSRFTTSDVAVFQLSPASGSIGQTVKVQGTGFSSTPSEDSVTFNGTAATISSASETELAVTVPTGATTGPVHVVAPAGQATSTNDFTVVAAQHAPTISGVSPAAVSPGDPFTVSGSDLGDAGMSRVQINQTQTSAASGSGSSLQVTTPQATGSGRVSITTPEGVATGPDLYIAPSGLTPQNLTATGRLTLGTGRNFSLASTSAYGMFLFDGVAGQKVFINVASTSPNSCWGSVSLLGTDGTGIVNGNSVCGQYGGGTIDTVTLPADGTYAVLVKSTGGTGSGTVTAYSAPDVTGTVQPSAAGSSQTATLGTGQNAVITFSGSAGDRVSVAVGNVSGFSGYWGAVYLYKPDGSQLAWANLYATGGFIDTQTLPTSGTYTIRVDPFGSQTGSARVTAYSVADLSGTLQPTTAGAAQQLQFGTPGQQAPLTFSGTQGQRVSLAISGWAMSAPTGITPSTNLKILAPNGSQVGALQNFTGNGFFDAQALPQTGTYTIVVDPSERTTGSLTLTAYDASDSTAQLTPSAAGSAADFAIATPGQNGTATFSGSAGDRVSVLVGQVSGFSCYYQYGYLYLLKPDGSTLASRSLCGTADFLDTQTLPTSGTYTIRFDPSGTQTGSARVTAYSVADLSGTLPTDGSQVTKSFVTPGQNGSLQFTGSSGQALTLTASQVTIANSYLSVKNPSGSTLMGPASIGTGGGTFNLSLTQTGTHTVFVDPYDRNTGDLTLSLGTGGPHAAIQVGGQSGDSAPAEPSTAPAESPSTPSGETSSTPSVDKTEPARDSASQTGRPRARCGRPASDGGNRCKPTHRRHLDNRQARASRHQRVFPLTAAAARELTADASVKPPLGRASSDGPDSLVHINIGGKGEAWGGDVKPVRRQTESHRPAQARAKQADKHRKVAPRSPLRQKRRARSHTEEPAAATPEINYRPVAAPAWHPNASNLGGNWRANREDTPWASLPPLQAPSGVTALTGQALVIDGTPLAGVQLSIEGTHATARTDRTGRFLLKDDVPSGHHVLDVDANQTASPLQYGTYKVGVDISDGETTALDYKLWMTSLDPAGDAPVKSPTDRETVLTTPRIPGLEVHVPAGSVITDADGHRLKSLNLTAIPVDRPPFPLPPFIQVPTYFSAQPGGAYLSKGARVIYPNYQNLPAHQRVDFWSYDPHGRGWHVYGRGRVSGDGQQVIPDPGVRIWEFTGAMYSNTRVPPATAPNACGLDGGDPVDLSTGLFTRTERDLALSDNLPLSLSRTYRPKDTNSYSFGVGTESNFDMWTYWTGSYTNASVVLGCGSQVKFVRTSPGTGYTDAVYQAQTTPGRFFGSILRWDSSVPGGGGWKLTLRSGTSYVFGAGTNGSLMAVRDRNGNQITITRANGQTGNVSQITSPHGRWIRFTYGTGNRITQAQDNAGQVVSYTYDGSGRLATKTDPMGRVTSYGYDAAGDMTSITDARGNQETNVYDANGRVTAQTNPLGGTFSFNYQTDANGHITQTTVTDPRGAQERVTFDGQQNPVEDVKALGTAVEQTTTMQRDAASNLLQSVTDPLGRTTTYGYDSQGNVTQVTRAAGTSHSQTWTATYHPTYGQLTSVTDPLGHQTTYGLDDHGNVTGITDALGRHTTITRNGSGQVTGITDPLSHTTQFQYTWGDLTGVTDPLGRTRSRFVDGAGRTRSLTDPAGNRTRFDYNQDNELTQVTAPSGAQTTFAYNATGNRTQIIDARGNSVSTTYNAMGQPLTETDALNRTSSWGYNNSGDVASQTDRKGQTIGYTRDVLGRITERTFPSSSISYGYDGAGRLTSADDSNAGQYTVGYDDFNNVTSASGPTGTVSYTYDDANRETSVLASGLVQNTYSYDDANELTGITGTAGTATMSYYGDGRLQNLTLPNGIVQSYGYDVAGQTTSIGYDRGTSHLADLNYAYDAAGRERAVWGGWARTGLPDPIQSATYDAANQLQSLTRPGGSPVNYNYDANGNMTSDGTNSYSWNARNELIGISGGALSASFAYDPFGRRQSRTVNGSTRDYLYQGQNVLEELNGSTLAATLLTGLKPDQLLGRSTPGGTVTYLTDRLGSTVALADASGTPTTSYTYDPFGASSSTGATSSNPYQFTGRENDGTGLQYNRARYYSPAYARFMSEDPLGIDGGDINHYAYVGGDPVDTLDPSGLSIFSDVSNFVSDTANDAADLAESAFSTAVGVTESIGCSLSDAAHDFVNQINFSTNEFLGDVATIVIGYGVCAAATAGATAVGTPAAGVAAAATCFGSDAVTWGVSIKDIFDDDNSLWTDGVG
jgi:RHS repeat-associated protein